MTWAILRASVVAALLLVTAGDVLVAPTVDISPNDRVTVDGTARDDAIVIDGRAGTVTLNGRIVRRFIPDKDSSFHIKTYAGNDTVTVIDGPGNDFYMINTGTDGDTVEITDMHSDRTLGESNDIYRVITGEGADKVTVTDSQDAPSIDEYDIDLGGDSDTLKITDGLGADTYKVNGGGSGTDTLDWNTNFAERNKTVIENGFEAFAGTTPM